MHVTRDFLTCYSCSYYSSIYVASDESFAIVLYTGEVYRISLNDLFLSNKVQSSERIKLAKWWHSKTNEEEVIMGLKNFFSSAVINLKIPKF